MVALAGFAEIYCEAFEGVGTGFALWGKMWSHTSEFCIAGEGWHGFFWIL